MADDDKRIGEMGDREQPLRFGDIIDDAAEHINKDPDDEDEDLLFGHRPDK